MIADPTDHPAVADAQVSTVREAGADIEITVNQTAHHGVDPHGPGLRRARSPAERDRARIA